MIYVELLETRRQYLCGLTPCWALPMLLLAASSLDTDAAASRWVVDGWLMLRVHDGTGRMVCSVCFAGCSACFVVDMHAAASRWVVDCWLMERSRAPVVLSDHMHC